MNSARNNTERQRNGGLPVAIRRTVAGLAPAQVATLKGWLIRDGLTYQQVQVKMMERFGFKFASGTLSNFYQGRVQPGKAVPASRPVLEIEIESAAPVQVRIVSSEAYLKFKAGSKQRFHRCRADKKSFTVMPFRKLRK